MNRHLIYIAILALTACTADDTLTGGAGFPARETLETPPHIIISGGSVTASRSTGGPSASRVPRALLSREADASRATRATDPTGHNLPYQSGECLADRLLLRFYRAYSTDNHPSFSPSEMKIEDNAVSNGVTTSNDRGIEEVPVTRQDNPNARTATCMHWYNLKKNTKNAFVVTGLAFRDADRSNFTVSSDANGARFDQASVSLVGSTAIDGSTPRYTTPDLYFGPLKMTSLNYDNHKTNLTHGIFYLDASTSGLTEYSYVYNTIFRVVGQANLTIRDVPTSVAALELLSTAVPTTMTLYGNHGGTVFTGWEPYPVAAATASQCTSATAKASIAAIDLTNNNLPSATVTLPSYLFPSEVGREMTLRVWYRSPIDDQGTMYRDFPVAPMKSATLGNNTDTDNSGNANYTVPDGDERIASASPRLLYVYNSTSGKFYSYSNVRVNISADYPHIVSETVETAFTIDVEPAFERTHTFEAI